jgi:hypothetical protein
MKRACDRGKRVSTRDAAGGADPGCGGRDTNFTCAMRCERREMDFMAAMIGAGPARRRGRIPRARCGIFGNPD